VGGGGKSKFIPVSGIGEGNKNDVGVGTAVMTIVCDRKEKVHTSLGFKKNPTKNLVSKG